MKKNIKILYVIEKSPDSNSKLNIIDKIKEHDVSNNAITIYIQNDGIQWLYEKYWHELFRPNEHLVYYANATDARKYEVPFREGVIFSNPKIFHELLIWADQINFIH
jgi:hypothetical protein